MDTAAFSKIASCSACMLYKSQRPLLDPPRLAEVCWVGLSAVKVDDIGSSRPLASDTRTGGLLEDIETRLGDISFYRTNLVKCFPESSGRIRYPKRDEMRSCFPNFVSEIEAVSPRVVLLLGKQVAEYVFKERDAPAFSLDSSFGYTAFIVAGVAYVPVHHPSYVLIYNRRRLATYVDQICKVINEHVALPY